MAASKVRKCRICKAPALGQSIIPVCSPRCALELAKCAREKKETRDYNAARKVKKEVRQEIKARKEKLLTIKARQKRARTTAQEYARLRDMQWFESMGEQPKCIMCGKTDVKSWHGCHFIPVGSKGGPKSLHPCNINLGCGQCNFFAAQESTQYRENMIVKYGQEIVDYLEKTPLDYVMSSEDIEEIRTHFKQLTKELKR